MRQGNFTLYHYFEASSGPLKNLSALDLRESCGILKKMKEDATGLFAAHRFDGYMDRRIELEGIIRTLFKEKGGKPEKSYPHYFVVEECPWFEEWYNETSRISKSIGDFKIDTVSFTYGTASPLSATG